MVEYKQPQIAEELKRRIAEGIYSDRIPSSRLLAEEFDVNIKTVHKAVRQLVEQGLLERKKRSGTRIVPLRRDRFPERMIEVIQGLNAGDSVIITGLMQLREGVPVSVSSVRKSL